MTKSTTNFFFISSYKESTKLLCDLCSIEDEYEATHFCKTCEDPDPLCETCAKRHLREKPFRSHEMCSDIEQFPNKEKKEWYLVILFDIKIGL